MNKLPARKPIRLKGYDYSMAGYYYVTICTYNRAELFGRICDDKMESNNAGEMVNSILNNLPQHVATISIDQGVVMPNHIHAIIIINHVGADLCVGPLQDDKLLNNGQAQRPVPTDNLSLQDDKLLNNGQAQRPVPTDNLSLSDIIHRFKTITTKKYIDGVKNDNWKPFNKHLWQRSFHDHIIRNDKTLNKIREYIINNPTTWIDDNENVKNKNVGADLCVGPLQDDKLLNNGQAQRPVPTDNLSLQDDKLLNNGQAQRPVPTDNLSLQDNE